MAKIAAIVVYEAGQVAGGGAPVFIAKSPEEQQSVAFTLEKILDANAHDLNNGVIVLVDHASS